MWMDASVTNNWVIHNSEFTRYAPHQKPSIIDHIISNCPAKISLGKTSKKLISDHCYLTFEYIAKGTQTKPKFRWNRNFSNLTETNLIQMVESNY